MPSLSKDINNLSVPEKAELFYLLRNDEKLKEYMISNKILFEELDRRDKSFREGKIQLTSRKQLSTRLKDRRDAL